MLAAFAVAAVLSARDPDLYYRIAQEDELVEWGSAWAFLLASLLHLALALRCRPLQAWFSLGVAAFCLFVAGEEVSWGQRLVGYRPPAYFLEHNFQQELNVHNVVDKELRKAALTAVIAGYGLLLPLLGWAAPRLTGRLGVWPPPAALAPAFLATLIFYLQYPLDFSGEWVELALGLGFLFSGALLLTAGEQTPGLLSGPTPSVLVSLAVVALLAVATEHWTREREASRPELVDLARLETEALGADLAEGEGTRCGLHKRLYTFRAAYRADQLAAGRFAALTQRGLPEDRARFFLDPWNSPYWIRSTCDGKADRRATLVYSFGPNRRRDSGPWQLEGDDVGSVVASR
jgi:hypothetical protein